MKVNGITALDYERQGIALTELAGIVAGGGENNG